MITAAQISALVDGYRASATTIDKLNSRIEKEIAATALRQNATATLNQITTRAQGATPAALAPLKDWVAGYSGEGKTAEKVVGKVDDYARKGVDRVIKDVRAWALAGNASLFATGIFGTIAGIVLGIADFGHDSAQHLISAAAAGGVPAGFYFLVVRGAQHGDVLVKAVRTTYQDAGQLGKGAEKILAETTTPLEKELWAAAGGKPHPGVIFITQLRERAQLLVGAAIAICSIGVVIFLFGAFAAWSEYSTNH